MFQYLIMIFGLLGSMTHLPLIVLYFFNIRMFHITDRKAILAMCKKLPNRSTMISDAKMSGYIWGFWYVGYINTYTNTHKVEKTNLYFISTQKYYNKISMMEEEKDDNTNSITTYDRFGNYYCLEYSKRKNMIEYTPTPKQKEIIERITNHYNDNTNLSRSVVTMLSGSTGVGKSTLPFILAREFKGSICKTFNPTDPGDDFSVLYNTVNPEKDSPLIILLDEVDTIIHNINNNNIKMHETIPTKIRDKTSWNGFWDDINRGDFKYTIWILTTNKPFDYFDTIDPSYTREGRVNIKMHIV